MSTTDQDTPTTCHICTRQAVGIGVGNPAQDPKWICRECLDIIEYVKSAKRPSAYELKAREGGMEAAAPLVAEFGSNLAEWEEDQVLQFVGAVWFGCADRMRQLIKDGSAPF